MNDFEKQAPEKILQLRTKLGWVLHSLRAGLDVSLAAFFVEPLALKNQLLCFNAQAIKLIGVEGHGFIRLLVEAHSTTCGPRDTDGKYAGVFHE